MSADREQILASARNLLASNRTQAGLAAILAALCLAFSAALIHSAFSAFTWFKFAMFDYGIYTNMVWNSGHGHLFQVLTTRTYLKTHLSFSLALLGPLFHFWDHPFLLSLLQWLMIVGGAVIITVTGFRHRIAPCLVLAVALFCVGYPFVQSVHLCEFHGVSAYLLLVPWLYSALSFRKQAAWIPLTLLLGLREDAFLTALPILAYFAVRDRSRLVWVMFAVSLLYGLLAMFWLYPMIAGKSLLERRAGCIPDGAWWQVFGAGDVAMKKIRALAWVVLPLIFFARRGWPAILTFTAAPVITTLASTFGPQYELKLHYPATVMACMGIALIESTARSVRKQERGHAVQSACLAICLVVVTLGAHIYRGYLPFGGKHKPPYSRPNPAGLAALKAARRLPKDGVLITPINLAPFCANRPDIKKWKILTKPEREYDLVFIPAADLLGKHKQLYRDLQETGGFKLRRLPADYVALERSICGLAIGAAHDNNAE